MKTLKALGLAIAASMVTLPALATDCSDQTRLAGSWLVGGGDASVCEIEIRPRGLIRGRCRVLQFDPRTNEPILLFSDVRGTLNLRADCGIEGSVVPGDGDRFAVQGRVWATSPAPGSPPEAGIFVSTRRNAPFSGHMVRALPTE